jgi:hypothetical protein
MTSEPIASIVDATLPFSLLFTLELTVWLVASVEITKLDSTAVFLKQGVVTHLCVSSFSQSVVK